VAEAQKYAKWFGNQGIIHRAELLAQPDGECAIDGHVPVELASEFTILPTPRPHGGTVCFSIRVDFGSPVIICAGTVLNRV
jgi:hypothetical protein